jgi:glycosyltransferase involved in cell wall biosynthesis
MADRPPAVPHLSFEPWSEAGEVPFLHGLTAGVMPLLDDPFSRGKCGFKLLEYMACGLPWVASPVGVNVDLADGGRAGILAESSDEWVAALERLADPRVAAALGTHGRELVAERWSSEVWGPRWAATLASACGRSRAG